MRCLYTALHCKNEEGLMGKDLDEERSLAFLWDAHL